MLSQFFYNSGLLIGHSISNVQNGNINLMVLNASLKQLVIPKGTQLASCETLLEERDQHISEAIQAILKLKGKDEFVHISDQLTDNQIKELGQLLESRIDAFSINGQLGLFKGKRCQIELEPNAKPFAETLRRRAPFQIEETERQVSKMLKENIIEESESPWASSYVQA